MATEERKQDILSRGGTAVSGTEKTEGPVTREEMRTMFRAEQMQVPTRTWKPTTAGLLSIVTGYLNILVGIGLLIGASVPIGASIIPSLPSFVGVGMGLGILLIVLGIVSVLGGVAAIRRRMWGCALAGSIAALFPSLFLIPGVLSLILVTLGRQEFKK